MDLFDRAVNDPTALKIHYNDGTVAIIEFPGYRMSRFDRVERKDGRCSVTELTEAQALEELERLNK